jgi:hypothetical protein
VIQVSGPGATRNGASNDYELCSLAQLKVLLKLPAATDATQDAFLQAALDSVHQSVYSYTGGRIFRYSATPYVQLYRGRNERSLSLNNRPIVVLTSIEEGYLTDSSGAFTVARAFTSADFYVDKDNGIVHGINLGWFFPGMLSSIDGYNYRVTYTAGFQTVPMDLQQAVADWVGVLTKHVEKKTWDVQSESFVSGEAKTYVLSEMPESSETILQRYRRSEAFIA